MAEPAAGEVGGMLPACLWQGDAFHLLTGLIPGRAALHALARPITEQTWTLWSQDPAALLLLVSRSHGQDLRTETLLAHLSQPDLIPVALKHWEDPSCRFVDLHRPEPAPLRHAQVRIATLARDRAEATLGRVDPVQAWIAGMLAPLGWLAVAAVAPDRVAPCLADPSHRTHPLETQSRCWGLDQDALTRHLARRWQLPNWLARVLGHLRLTPDLAVDLGARRALFEIVQQAVRQAATEGHHLGLVDGDYPALPAATPTPDAPLPTHPGSDPLLRELLVLAEENRRLHTRVAGAHPLEQENDRLLATLAHRLVEEQQQQQTARLQALAELAAGAGHEINNPLAVISGRAQYLLARRESWGQPDGAAALAESLDTIIAQTRRIHSLLRQMMLFARPPAPQRRSVDAVGLACEVVEALRTPAAAQSVHLSVAEVNGRFPILVDPDQVKQALTALVRNAIEAAPEGGWVRVMVRMPHPAHSVEMIVEDNGPGASAEQVPYLFDPFYSGRSAGRGRGLGLPVAWQLLRQQGGGLQYVRSEQGPTQLVVVLPLGCESRSGGDARTGGEAA